MGFRPAGAAVVFQENFDSHPVTYSTNDPYWSDNTKANGYIVQTTADVPLPWSFGTEISSDVSGPGHFFLFNGTDWYSTAGTFIPPSHDQFYISPVFAVTPHTDYQVSFYLTSANQQTDPPPLLIQGEIGGTLLGTQITPGTYASSGWQRYAYNWNSGTNTSASLVMHDYTTTPVGNDFGLDQITVQSIPLPSSVVAGLAGLALCVLSRSRTKAA